MFLNENEQMNHALPFVIIFIVKMFFTFLEKCCPINAICIDYSGTMGDEEHWRYCIADTESMMGFAVGAMFVRETFQGESKSAVCFSFIFAI